MKVDDLPHTAYEGRVTDLSIGETECVSFVEAGGKKHENVEMGNYATTQLLKFADLKKTEAREMSNDKLLRKMPDKTLVFKVGDESGKVLGVVSPWYQRVRTRDIDVTVKGVLRELDFDVGNIEVDRSLTTDAWYTIEGMETKAGLKPGIHIKNSAFGASALRIERFWRIPDNDSRLPRDAHSFQKYHVGEEEIRFDEVRKEVRDLLNLMWHGIDDVKNAKKVHFSKGEQVSKVQKYADDKRITKTMASDIVSHIDYETWGSEDDTVWAFVKTLCGYAQHGGLSSQNRRRVERMAQEVLKQEARQKVTA